MKYDKTFVLTFVLKDAEINNYKKLIGIIKNFLLSLDIKIKKQSVLKKNKACDFYFSDNATNFKLKNLRKRIWTKPHYSQRKRQGTSSGVTTHQGQTVFMAGTYQSLREPV